MMFNRGSFVGARKYYLRKGGPMWTSRKAQRRELVFDSPSLFRPIYRRIQKSQIAEVHAHHDIRRTADSEH